MWKDVKWGSLSLFCDTLCHLPRGTKGNDVAQVLCLPAKMRAEDLRWTVGMLHVSSYHVLSFLVGHFQAILQHKKKLQ